MTGSAITDNNVLLLGQTRDELWEHIKKAVRRFDMAMFDGYSLGKNIKLVEASAKVVKLSVPTPSLRLVVMTYFNHYFRAFWRRVYPDLDDVEVIVRDALTSKGYKVPDVGINLKRKDAPRRVDLSLRPMAAAPVVKQKALPSLPPPVKVRRTPGLGNSKPFGYEEAKRKPSLLPEPLHQQARLSGSFGKTS